MRQQDETISVTTQDTVPEKYRTKAGIEEPLAVIPPQVALPSIREAQGRGGEHGAGEPVREASAEPNLTEKRRRDGG